MYTRIYCYIRQDDGHDSIVFPNDGLFFAVPKGYGNLHIEIYKQIVKEIREKVMW